jgi:hypothetical protein
MRGSFTNSPHIKPPHTHRHTVHHNAHTLPNTVHRTAIHQLASGGNDNKLFIWNAHSSSPLVRFNDHTAAVKAIAWSPHQHGLLTSGGGTADRCIRFWNTLTGTPLNCIDTGSQVRDSSALLARTGSPTIQCTLPMQWQQFQCKPLESI